MTVHPGQGLDTTALRNVLLGVIAVYVGAFLFGWLQGRITAVVVQRTMLRLRAEVEAKLDRLPLRVLRPPAARRGALARHQRHRQRRPDASSRRSSQLVTVAAHRHRRARHDVLDLAAARRRRARHRAAVGARDGA